MFQDVFTLSGLMSAVGVVAVQVLIVGLVLSLLSNFLRR
jgi:Tfp pilus assembly major pilin PilA